MTKEERAIVRKIAFYVKTARGCSHCGTGLTIRAAAKLIGISSATLVRIEKGQHFPDLITFLMICKWRGASADKLLGLRDGK